MRGRSGLGQQRPARGARARLGAGRPLSARRFVQKNRAEGAKNRAEPGRSLPALFVGGGNLLRKQPFLQVTAGAYRLGGVLGHAPGRDAVWYNRSVFCGMDRACQNVAVRVPAKGRQHWAARRSRRHAARGADAVAKPSRILGQSWLGRQAWDKIAPLPTLLRTESASGPCPEFRGSPQSGRSKSS